MNEGLLRQRRNLFITSVILFVLKDAGIAISKLSFAGFEITVSNPRLLYGCLWIAFAYFFYRYYQYFTAEGLAKLSETFAAVLDKKCAATIYALVQKAHPDMEPGLNFTYRILKDRKWIYCVQKHIKDESGTTIRLEDVNVPIGRWSLRRGITFALLEGTFRDSVVTDYLLPFVVGMFVLWYCGRGEWPGSFSSLLFSAP
jgi:hypothetical protein